MTADGWPRAISRGSACSIAARVAEPRDLKSHSSQVTDLAFTSDGQYLATVSVDRLLRVQRFPAGDETLAIVTDRQLPHAVAITPDGRTIATAGEDKAVTLWNMPTGQSLATLGTEILPIKSLEFSADGQQLLARMVGETVIVYDAAAATTTPEQATDRRDAAFTGLGNLPGDSLEAPENISHNGRFVSGLSKSGKTYNAFRWSADESIRSFAIPSGNSQASAVTDDGQLFGSGRCVQNDQPRYVAMRWPITEEPWPIERCSSHVEDVTPDGAVAVGTYWDQDKQSQDGHLLASGQPRDAAAVARPQAHRSHGDLRGRERDSWRRLQRGQRCRTKRPEELREHP